MMVNISNYDERQLKLMYQCLISFENNQIELSSLVGSLEFLLNAMESVNEDWENKFLKEITILESINAIEAMEESENENLKINKEKSINLINKAISSLKTLIQMNLS